jgi:DNA-binding NtrC family response regulator
MDRAFTVVLAEDDDELRTMLASLLRRDGHRVIEVSDGRRLLAGLSRGDFDDVELGDNVLVVTDARMPFIDGLAVMRALQQRGKKRRFILMTAFADPQVHVEAAHLGAITVFDKPFELDDLRWMVRHEAIRVGRH